MGTYNDTCNFLLDKYVPIKIQGKGSKPNQPWYNKNTAAALGNRCKLEIQYHHNPEIIQSQGKV